MKNSPIVASLQWIVAFLLIAVPTLSPAAGTGLVLRWKIGVGSTLTFATSTAVIAPEDSAFIEIEPETLCTLESGSGRAVQQVEGLPAAGNSDISTVMEGLPRGQIQVCMFNEGSGSGADEGEIGVESPQLCGTVDASGDITSWYLASEQKNLLSLLTELPDQPVKPGESWSIDINLIGLGTGYRIDKAERRNRVHLTSVESDASGGMVATIDYCIVESVEGVRANPLVKTSTPVALSMGFVGRGRFNVAQGRWDSLRGRLFTQSADNGIDRSQQMLSLRPSTEAR